MKKLMIIPMLLALGCATKTRNVEVDGMFTQAETGILTIGSVDVMASPIGEESLVAKYEENTAWLSPSTKVRSVKLQLTGTNTCEQATTIVQAICSAMASTTNAVVR